MTDLLEFALAAHGGSRRWSDFFKLEAKVTLGGSIWEAKNRPGMPHDVHLVADLYKQRVLLTPFDGEARRGVFETDAVSIETLAGQVIERFHQPRDAFEGHLADTAWNAEHAAYFSGYSVWSYLTQPFLYTYPGFRCDELSPWSENGEQWRRLHITFPDHLARHSREQIAYFGPDGLLRRHDYDVDVLGGISTANYAAAYRNVNGIQVPTQRRIHRRHADGGRPDGAPLVSIDVHEIAFI